jgi:hypothetical protein
VRELDAPSQRRYTYAWYHNEPVTAAEGLDSITVVPVVCCSHPVTHSDGRHTASRVEDPWE